VSSASFFTGRGQAGELGFQAIMLLASYPTDLFAGPAKLVLYTILPAALVSSVPAHLMRDFDVVEALVLLGGAALCGLAGWAVFRAGLRRYTSGASWSQA
jgi:ABC-2 type transport system permease protein